ncbi:MAG: DUF4097 family beta strand repeat-containing protein [Anaerolineae bacterium]
MSELNTSWPAESVDAIRITLLKGQVAIEGTDGNQIELEGEMDQRGGREVRLDPMGRWLPLSLWGRHGESNFTLRLPKSKAWVVDLYATQAEVEVSDIQARLSVRLGKGDVRVENCRGQFALMAGRGDVEIEGCTEADMPERPPVPEGMNAQFGPIPPTPPIPPIPPVPPIPPMEANGPKVEFGFGHRGRMHMRMDPKMRIKMRMGRGDDRPGAEPEGDWEDWNGEEWARWGEEIGERAAAWAEGFVSQVFSQFGGVIDKKGVSLQLGRGDVKIEDLTARECHIGMGGGDVELDGGCIDNLTIQSSHGDIEIDEVLPAGTWSVDLRHGDIELSLPSDTRARLDVATRHGDIQSDVPLVRVNRPGRESRHGGRMVGTSGPSEGAIAQISLTTVKGDIHITGPKGESGRRERAPESAWFTPPPPPPTSAPTTDASPVGGRATDAPASPLASSPDASRAGDVPAGRAADAPAGPRYNSQVEILKALAENKISVAEAEQLLKSIR